MHETNHADGETPEVYTGLSLDMTDTSSVISSSVTMCSVWVPCTLRVHTCHFTVKTAVPFCLHSDA